VALDMSLRVGDRVQIVGTETDFRQTITQMRLDHEKVNRGKPAQKVWVAVEARVRPGDAVIVLPPEAGVRGPRLRHDCRSRRGSIRFASRTSHWRAQARPLRGRNGLARHAQCMGQSDRGRTEDTIPYRVGGAAKEDFICVSAEYF
jgi:hypothetical protein